MDKSSSIPTPTPKDQVVILHQHVVPSTECGFDSAQSVVRLVRDKVSHVEFILKLFLMKDNAAFEKELSTLTLVKERNLHKAGFPYIISNKKGINHCEILMEKLGLDLQSKMNEQKSQRFSARTVFLLMVQLVERIQELHKLNLIHNDIKLENFLIGDKDPGTVYLIDFGLVQPYMEEGKHIKKVQTKCFTGNFLFASINSCRGFNKSRRDDMESLMYLAVYMLCGNRLPWSNFCKNQSNSIKDPLYWQQLLNQRNSSHCLAKFFNMCPPQMLSIVK